MNVYNWLISHFGVSALDALLLVIVFVLAKARYQELSDTIRCHEKRLDRLEKSCLSGGINLLELED